MKSRISDCRGVSSGVDAEDAGAIANPFGSTLLAMYTVLKRMARAQYLWPRSRTSASMDSASRTGARCQPYGQANSRARQDPVKLIGMLDSPYVRRVAISLQLLDLGFEHQALSVFRTFAEF